MQDYAIDTKDGVLSALRTRRSRGRVRPEQPPRELIEQIIEAAGWGPNHYHTEPWRFFVLAGTARDRLGEVMADSLAGKLGRPGDPEADTLVDKERRKPLRAPVVIAVATVPPANPKAIETEDLLATGAAVENMLLAAEAVGLHAMWRTGAPAYDPAVRAFFGLPDNSHIVAFVYVGYPDNLPIPDRPRDSLQHATWMGWDDE